MVSQLTFALENASWKIVIPPNILNVFDRYVQDTSFNESAGQLFCNDPFSEQIIIKKASISLPMKASRFGICISHRFEVFERKKQYKRGFHCIGMWHTHPQAIPILSQIDIDFGKDHAIAAKNQRNGFILCIRGQADYPDGLYVGIHNGAIIQKMILQE